MTGRSCYHCGIDNTGLWRTGPSEKPVLCNACGTRWRLKGTLADYIPKHGLSKMQSSPEKAELKVPRRKRSVLPQYCLTSTGILHRQLLQIQHEQQSAAKTSASGEKGNDVLIYNTSWMTSSDQTALGTMLDK